MLPRSITGIRQFDERVSQAKRDGLWSRGNAADEAARIVGSKRDKRLHFRIPRE